jgi:hypothetical protein
VLSTQPKAPIPSRPGFLHIRCSLPSMPMPEANSRPYRSHKIRACDFCRKRKTRCTLELPGKACVMCRVASVNCCYEGTEDVGRQSKRPRAGSDESGETSSQYAPHRFSPQPGNHKIRKQEANLVDMESESIHIVGPIMANDAQVVERYMSPKDTISQDKAQYTVYSNDSREPILYTKVSRCRPGLQPSGVAGAQQRVIIEQILGPFTEELINTYVTVYQPILLFTQIVPDTSITSTLHSRSSIEAPFKRTRISTV